MPYSHPQPIDKQAVLLKFRHMLPGAAALAGAAGYINSVSLGFFHAPVSHMTGAVSRMGLDAVEGRWRDALASFSILLGFVVGAAMAGMIVGAWKLVPGRRYGVAMVIEGILLSLACVLLMFKTRWALPALSMSCGLQNAMTSSYCGLIIRTTHVTGLVTDIGVMFGHWVRHRQVQAWKIRFLFIVLVSFTVGGAIGALADWRFGPICLVVPAAGALIAGGVYWGAHHYGLVDAMQDASPHTPVTGSFPSFNKDS
jgi:uncharacterized membrane protein YoaK (UPF0700 family)